MTHLFQNFLADKAEYARAEAFWAALWREIPESDRRRGGWRSGWFPAESFKDGNPIFTAVSESQRKAIRVVQYEPTCQEVEFDFWLDTFGGDATEPQSICELVIACALTDEAAQTARKLMSSWVRGGKVDLTDAAERAIKTTADESECR